MSRPSRLGLVVQARLGSTRLARKALLPLGGLTMADQVLRRLILVPAEVYVLATDEASAPELGPIAARNGFELLVGPAEDVLARYCLAVRRFGLGRVLRATGDNPLVAHELAATLVSRAEAAEAAGAPPADYTSYSGLPLGMGVELVRAEALLRAEAEARELPEREHVCPYLYGHPELFRLDRPEAPEPWRFPEARVTVDTAADYEAVLRLYGALYSGSPVPTELVYAYLRGQGRAA
ncbi:MAG TPA: NTP transferase domain-containing protein [Spirochaetia bacterium]|nr:NTP transferase domain-containing protein [Spirochaetales bacterium]HRY73452.1 NTP transferase domain-containing protein [Spirochaetia bacterium]